MINAVSKCIRVCEPTQKNTDTLPEEVNFAYSIAVHFQNGRYVCDAYSLREVCHDSQHSNDSCQPIKKRKQMKIEKKTLHILIGKNCICKSFLFFFVCLANTTAIVVIGM